MRDRVLARRHRLDRSPDLDRAVAVARGGVDRLVRRMRDVRQHEAPLDDRRRTLLQEFARPAPDQRGDALLGFQRRIEHGVNLGAREIALAAAVEDDVERIDRTLGLPVIVGDDADRVVARRVLRMVRGAVLIGDRHRRQLHHGAHAGHLENFGLVVDRDHLPGEGGRRLDGGVEHAGHHHVDAVDRAAIALGRRVQARDRLADQGKPAAILERRHGVERKLGGFARRARHRTACAPCASMTEPFSVRHFETSMLQRCAAARVSTSRAAAPATRSRS